MCLETKHWLKLVFFRPKKGRKPKNHLSKENVWFQLQKVVFWFSLGFFGFFVFFGFSNFFWFFQLPDLKKLKKKLKEKDGFS